MESAKTKAKPDSLIDLLAKHDACSDGVAWIKQSGVKTPAEAWEKCQKPDWMLWALEQAEILDERLLRKFMCWCVRNTPLGDGRKTWGLLTDERSRKAVEVAEAFAEGKATQEELSAAESAAWSAARSAQADALRSFIGNPFKDKKTLAKIGGAA